LVATFLALLELIKRQAIHARQDEECSEILLFPRAGAAARADELP
jgi:chromatin segregation and condensation protein Rec8/ScpA/Scc1 (kleisin family)